MFSKLHKLQIFLFFIFNIYIYTGCQSIDTTLDHLSNYYDLSCRKTLITLDSNMTPDDDKFMNKFKQELTNRGYSISQKLYIEQRKPRREWVVKNVGESQSYLIRKKGNIIKVYSYEKDLKYSTDRIDAILEILDCEKIPFKVKQELLIKASEDENEVVRSLAIRLMALTRRKVFMKYIKRAFKDKSSLVRLEAIQAIGTLHNYELLKSAMNKFSKDTEYWVRLKVLKSLEYIEAWNNSKNIILDFLIKALRDSEPAVRFQASLILYQITGKNLGDDQEIWKNWYLKNIKKT